MPAPLIHDPYYRFSGIPDDAEFWVTAVNECWPFPSKPDIAIRRIELIGRTSGAFGWHRCGWLTVEADIFQQHPPGSRWAGKLPVAFDEVSREWRFSVWIGDEHFTRNDAGIKVVHVTKVADCESDAADKPRSSEPVR